jgi:hypothetical protein
MEAIRRPAVFVVGDFRQAEFAEAMAWLEATAVCVFLDEIAAAGSGSLTLAEQPAAAIVIVQSRPGQISQGDVERLHAAAPLARLVALVGAWCERERQAWAGVVRVPVSSWRFRLANELGLADEEGSLGMLLPRTMTAAERIEASLARLRRSDACGLKAVVYSDRRANYDAIVDLLRQIGCERAGKDEAADVVLFDGWESIASCGGLQPELKDRNSPLRVLLMHFPRKGDFERARREAIDAALVQPVLASDLAEALATAESLAAEPPACASG